ncbi:formamidopyrimidine-DNA glycosylase, partial [Candidatus Woesearchaeota archaeon]|nr:formamidopyrimidine-DNA glycosylase [Candidatus Woesearchaeota archaeon]
IDIAKSIDKFIEEKELGADALSINKKELVELAEDSRGAVKNFLMDQSKIAGIGNIYADEILFQEGIHPKKKIENIDEKQLRKMYSTMKRVLKMGIKKQGERFPSGYLIGRRRAVSRDDEKAAKCPRCSGKIKNMTVGGRSTYYCDKHQKK